MGNDHRKENTAERRRIAQGLGRSTFFRASVHASTLPTGRGSWPALRILVLNGAMQPRHSMQSPPWDPLPYPSKRTESSELPPAGDRSSRRRVPPQLIRGSPDDGAAHRHDHSCAKRLADCGIRFRPIRPGGTETYSTAPNCGKSPAHSRTATGAGKETHFQPPRGPNRSTKVPARRPHSAKVQTPTPTACNH